MTTSNFSSSVVGWMAIAMGIAVILAVIFIILFFSVGQSFGTLNDIFNDVAGILSGMLAWMLYTEHHSKSALLSQFALILALVGALLSLSVRYWLSLKSQAGFWLGGIQQQGTP